METEGGFGIWAFALIGGPILLGLFIAYGVLQSRRRSRRLKQVTEESTKNNYRAEERREELREKEAGR